MIINKTIKPLTIQSKNTRFYGIISARCCNSVSRSSEIERTEIGRGYTYGSISNKPIWIDTRVVGYQLVKEIGITIGKCHKGLAILQRIICALSISHSGKTCPENG